MNTKKYYSYGNWGFKESYMNDKSQVIMCPEKIGKHIALVYNTTDENSIANAKLISAAPDLFEAIKYYLSVLKEANGENWDKNPDHVLQTFITAYNKAIK